MSRERSCERSYAKSWLQAWNEQDWNMLEVCHTILRKEFDWENDDFAYYLDVENLPIRGKNT